MIYKSPISHISTRASSSGVRDALFRALIGGAGEAGPAREVKGLNTKSPVMKVKSVFFI